MNIKRIACASTLTAGIGLAGLLGLGIGTAGADPGPPCGAPNAPQCQNGHPWGNQGPQNGPGPRTGPGPWNSQPAGADWQHRGFDQGRQDHQPFRWNGQRVEPLPAGNGDGWGFWFLGQWIRL